MTTRSTSTTGASRDPGYLRHPDVHKARQVLDDFALFWQREQGSEPRRQLLQHLFERVWIDDKRIVAVRPKPTTPPRGGVG